MNKLFNEIRIKNMTVKNRIAMPPMCMYCAGEDGKVVFLDDVLDFEEWISASQSQCLRLGCQGHYGAVVAREHAHGLALEPRVKGSLH